MMIITFLEYRIPKGKGKTSFGIKKQEERTQRLSVGGGRRMGIENTEGEKKEQRYAKALMIFSAPTTCHLHDDNGQL